MLYYSQYYDVCNHIQSGNETADCVVVNLLICFAGNK